MSHPFKHDPKPGGSKPLGKAGAAKPTLKPTYHLPTTIAGAQGATDRWIPTKEAAQLDGLLDQVRGGMTAKDAAKVRDDMRAVLSKARAGRPYA